MIAGFSTPEVVLVLAVVFAGGLVKGLAGFGYAVTGTAALATAFAPATAVVLLILPMAVANLALLTELGRDGMRRCAERFWPYVAAALVGTLAGMAALDRLPQSTLAVLLGLFTLGYVLVRQDVAAPPLAPAVADRCFRESATAKVVLGLGSGLVFGASNVAVQVVAYLDSLSLDRETFVGVLAMILVGVSSVRLVVAWHLGLFAAGDPFLLSAVAAVPGLAGVLLGARLRVRVPDRVVATGALALLAVVGVRLLLKGTGVA